MVWFFCLNVNRAQFFTFWGTLSNLHPDQGDRSSLPPKEYPVRKVGTFLGADKQTMLQGLSGHQYDHLEDL